MVLFRSITSLFLSDCVASLFMVQQVSPQTDADARTINQSAVRPELVEGRTADSTKPLCQFAFQPRRDDPDDLVVGLALLTAHVAGARNNPQVFRATMLGKQIKIADGMLVVLFAVDAEQRRAGLVDQPLRHQGQSRGDLERLLQRPGAENVSARVQ